MDQDKAARLLHERFMEWANRLRQGGGEHKVRRQWADYDQSWERLSNDRKLTFLGLAEEIKAALGIPELEAEVTYLQKELAQAKKPAAVPKKTKAKPRV